ncbi:MAG: CoxE, partial [Chloroflexales bacterium]
MDEKTAGYLTTHLLAFGYLLRELGVPVSPGQMLAALDGLAYVPITSREDFRAALRCMLVLRHEDLPLFETAFTFYWRTAPAARPASQLLHAMVPQLPLPRRQ